MATSTTARGKLEATQWPNLVTYAESHDEERMAYELTTYGNAFNGYDAKEESTAMDRLAMAHAFLLAIPGPKMIWQWGELGYQTSIFDCLNGTFAEGCKLDEKPAPWGDLANADRLGLAKTIAALNDLKKNQPAFGTYDLQCGRIREKASGFICMDPTKTSVLVGNFDVASINMVPGFPYVGTWYDHFTGQGMSVNNLGDRHDPSTWRVAPFYGHTTADAGHRRHLAHFGERGMHGRQCSELRSIG